MEQSKATYKFFNRADSNICLLIIEPWAEEYKISPGSEVVVTVTYSGPGIMELEIGEVTISMWLWQSCTASVSVNGERKLSRSMSVESPF